mgnify:CR=1 FL=1
MKEDRPKKTEAIAIIETIKRLRKEWTDTRKYDKADACMEILKAIKAIGF